jgi:hypothetical protein
MFSDTEEYNAFNMSISNLHLEILPNINTISFEVFLFFLNFLVKTENSEIILTKTKSK